MIVLDHMITKIFEAGKSLFTDLARHDSIDMVLIGISCLGSFPGHELLLRNDFCVMLCFLHVSCHQIQGAEALSTPHAFQDVLGLLLTTPQPNILSTDQLPWQWQVLLKNVTI